MAPDCSASTNASVSTLAPRPTLISLALGFMAFSTGASTRCRVCSVSGATITTQSKPSTTSASSDDA